MSKIRKLVSSPLLFLEDAKPVRRSPRLQRMVAIARAAVPNQRAHSAGQALVAQALAAARTTASYRVLLADNFHVNPRNFPSLFDVLRSPEYLVTVGVEAHTPEEALIKIVGTYGVQDRLAKYRTDLEEYSLKDLLSLRYHNVDILTSSIDEALSACIAAPSWQSHAVEKNRSATVQKLWEERRSLLLDCCAAAMFWTDYWRSLPDISRYHAAVVFSGSYIYARVLLALLSYTQARCFVCESFMTGYDYYFEERHRPIANATSMSHLNLFRSYEAQIGLDSDAWYRDKIRAFNKLRSMRNKNVQQPAPSPLPRLLRGGKAALILGQVVNDFSLISGDGTVLTSLPVYRELIERLLSDPQVYVLFKAHPWERKKQNVESRYTANALEDWVATLPEAVRSRVLVLEDANLKQLLGIADGVFTICSQSGIEAAAEGFKVFTIGGAFYDRGGFTNAFGTASEAAQAYLSGSAAATLTLDEFASFEKYLTVLLQRHLVNADASGQKKITSALRAYQPQRHVSAPQSELDVHPSWS